MSSTGVALYNLLKKIQKVLYSKTIIAGIFCDLERAFDCVDHEVLLSKLEYYDVKGKANLWFKLYLSNIYQTPPRCLHLAVVVGLA
jgi:hypothetical protein